MPGSWEMWALAGLFAWVIAAFVLGAWFGRMAALNEYEEFVGDDGEWKRLAGDYVWRDGERRTECQN